jgi:uncharacterized protein (TIGR00730 family)
MTPDHRSARQDIVTARHVPDTPQTRSSSYKLAFADPDFLTSDAMRAVRLQLELMKPEMILAAEGVASTIVMFGGARIPGPDHAAAVAPGLAALSGYYEQARLFAAEMTRRSLAGGGTEGVIATGGGPGVMEAGNRGAHEAGGRSIGLNIVLPHEQAPNAYVTPALSLNFHYFAIRKMHFLMRAEAICIFPGGFGTLDELFEALTLIQTGRMDAVPLLLFGRSFWDGIVNWQALAAAGTISASDLDLFRYVETAEEAVAVIDGWQGAKGRREAIPGR